MTGTSLNPAPSLGAVAREQLRMLAVLQRREFLVVGAIGGALVALGLWGLTQVDPANIHPDDAVPILPGLAAPLSLLGALWPIGVWRHDSPSRRSYFWSLPVARGPHTLLRVGLGWALLMGVGLVVMLATVLMAHAFAARAAGPVELSFAQWYVPLVAATLAYMLMSVLTVLVDSPFRWIIWALVAMLGAHIVAQVTEIRRITEAIARGFESLGVALGGPLATGAALGTWAWHVLGWFAAGAAALVAAAFLYRDG